MPLILSYIIFRAHAGTGVVGGHDLGDLLLLVLGVVLACCIIGWVIRTWSPDPFVMKIAMTILAIFAMLCVIDFFF